MADNKHALLRHITINKCLTNNGRNWSRKDLLDACSDAIYEQYGIRKTISERTFQYDINDMRSEAYYSAPIKMYQILRKRYYRYEDPNFSISNVPMADDELTMIKDVMISLSRFKGIPDFTWVDDLYQRMESIIYQTRNDTSVISFGNNEFLKGREYIDPIFKHIINKECINIKYQSFKSDKGIDYEFHPYFLKQFNNRWFVFGKTTGFDSLTNLALDRIVDIKRLSKEYIEKSDELDFDDYFDDIVGVSFPENGEVEEVILKVTKKHWPYIQTKPIHGSMKGPIEENDDFVWIKFNLMINLEFERLIFSYAEEVEVIKPISLREKIKEKCEKMLSNY
jgi:predicted DNA-binding transcriptional regulator YafY